jgi:hypothetical protein
MQCMLLQVSSGMGLKRLPLKSGMTYCICQGTTVLKEEADLRDEVKTSPTPFRRSINRRAAILRSLFQYGKVFADAAYFLRSTPCRSHSHDRCRVQKAMVALSGQETSAHQSHFDHLCRLVGQFPRIYPECLDKTQIR